ncbi:MAG: tyrosine-type recombinase/integrase [Proteobacteria bacterium]|nr:tyrosine-type recombinase/integrase [Pseudomonadota bacterium]
MTSKLLKLPLLKKQNNILSLLPINYIQAATSENTRKAYRYDIQHFIFWGGLLPTTPDILVRYLHEYADKLNSRTLKRRLTAISRWHIYQGFSDPTQNPIVKKTMIGIKNIHGKPRDKAPAIQLEQLELMINHLNLDNSLIAIRNNALLQLGFFGAFRRSELVSIRYEDLSFVPEGIEILIPRSKTDQAGEGQICAIPYGFGKLCPVNAIKSWCEKANISSGYVFRAIIKNKVLEEKPLNPQSVSLIIKELAKDTHLPNAEKYSGHSLRRGFATVASKKKASFVSIMRQGRWKHEGTVLSYIEETQRFEDNAATTILTVPT